VRKEVRSGPSDLAPRTIAVGSGEGARGLIPGKPHRRVERMTETSREKCRVAVSRRIQKRCVRFKPHNNRRKRTRQVSKASGPSILEDRWQRSGSFHEFGVREFGGQTKFLVS
jgi:hypothetical protein